MPARKKIISSAVIIVVIAGFLGWKYGGPAYAAFQERRMRAALASDRRTQPFLGDLAKSEKQLAEHPDSVEGYLAVGQVWKTFGEATQERRYFERSREVYARGARAFGEQNTVILLNAGNMEEQLGNFARAEELFKQAVRINPGQTEPYLELVDLYRYHMPERGDTAIRAVYRQAMDSVLTNASIVHSLAFYLMEQKQYTSAMPFFVLLKTNFPEEADYGKIIADLRERIARGEDTSAGSAASSSAP